MVFVAELKFSKLKKGYCLALSDAIDVTPSPFSMQEVCGQSRTQTLCCLTRMLDEIIGSGRIRFLDDLDWSFEIQCETTGSKCSQGKWRNPRHASDFQLCSLYSDGS